MDLYKLTLQQAKKQLLCLLKKEHLLPDGIDPDRPPAAMPRTLTNAFHQLLGRTPAALKAIQLEDLVGADEQANLPGTIDAYPNWRRKIGLPIEDMVSDPDLSEILKSFQRPSIGA